MHANKNVEKPTTNAIVLILALEWKREHNKFNTRPSTIQYMPLPM